MVIQFSILVFTAFIQLRRIRLTEPTQFAVVFRYISAISRPVHFKRTFIPSWVERKKKIPGYMHNKPDTFNALSRCIRVAFRNALLVHKYAKYAGKVTIFFFAWRAVYDWRTRLRNKVVNGSLFV